MSLENARSVAVVAAMVQELRPVVRCLGLAPAETADHPEYVGLVAGREIVAVVTSMGTKAATEVTASLLERRGVDHVMVVGICGAIDPGLPIGSLVVPEETVLEKTGRACRPSAISPHSPAGRLLTTDRLYTDPDEVRGLHAQGFDAVDMETGAIGALCEDLGVPWSVFRAVSDRAGDPAVDPALMAMTGPDGTPAPRQVARYVLRHPLRIPKMASLGRGMGMAISASTSALIDAIT